MRNNTPLDNQHSYALVELLFHFWLSAGNVRKVEEKTTKKNTQHKYYKSYTQCRFYQWWIWLLVFLLFLQFIISLWLPLTHSLIRSLARSVSVSVSLLHWMCVQCLYVNGKSPQIIATPQLLVKHIDFRKIISKKERRFHANVNHTLCPIFSHFINLILFFIIITIWICLNWFRNTISNCFSTC